MNNLAIHGVVKIEDEGINPNGWRTLVFIDKKGQKFEVTAYTNSDDVILGEALKIQRT